MHVRGIVVICLYCLYSDMYLEMSLHDHGEVSVVCLGHVLLVLAQLDGHDVAEMRARVVPEVTGLENQGAKKATMSHLEPAMKPRIRAFSGLVTLLAVRNISWASNICSLVSDKFLRCGATGVWIVCTVGCNNEE